MDTTNQPAPIRKSLLPTTPPPEFQFHTVLGARNEDGGCVLFPGDTGPAVIRRRVTYGDWEPVTPDHWADEPQGDARAAAVAAVLPPVDRAAVRAEAFDEAAEMLARLDPVKAALAGQHAWNDAAGLVRHMARQERRMADEEQPATEAPISSTPAAAEPWRGATEIISDDEVQRLAATGLVGYQQNRGRLLHCLHHKPVPASRYADFQEVTADDLPDGGICVHPRCGADLLAVSQTQPPARP